MTADRIKLMAAEIWFLRRMLKVKLTDTFSFSEVLERARKRKWVLKAKAEQHTAFFRHVMREEKLEHVVTFGEIIGKRSKVWQARKDQFRKWTKSKSNGTVLHSQDRKSSRWSPTSFDVAL